MKPQTTPEVEPRPLNPIADRDQLTLQLIDTALDKNVPWGAIAAALGLPNKAAAKKRHRELQRITFLRAHAADPPA